MAQTVEGITNQKDIINDVSFEGSRHMSEISNQQVNLNGVVLKVLDIQYQSIQFYPVQIVCAIPSPPAGVP